MSKKPKLIPSVNEQARALFQRAGNGNVAVAVDTRPKVVRNRKAYTRKGRRGSWA